MSDQFCGLWLLRAFVQTHVEIIIGQVHLTVANLDRSLAFYCDLIGLQKGESAGDVIVLVPKTHPLIVLNPPHQKLVQSLPEGHTGFFHFSFLYPHRKELARIVKRFIDAVYDIEYALDHGIVEAVYLRDPDGIPVELYVECSLEKRSRNEYERARAVSTPIDLESLLLELK